MRSPLSRARACVALIVFCMLLGRCAAGDALAAPSSEGPVPGQWDPPINLSSSPNDSVWPRIAGDLTGNVHVTWVELDQADAKRYDGPDLYFAMWDGTGWSRPVDIILNPPGYFHLPSIVVDPFGSIHLFWHNWSRLYQSVAQADAQPWSARAWSPATSLTDYDTRPYWSDVASSRSDLYVVWEYGDIFFQHSGDGGETWSEPVRIAETELSSHRARIVRDDAGVLHVVWDDADEKDEGQIIWYARSADNGQNWEAMELYNKDRSSDGRSVWWAAITASSNYLLVTWVQSSALFSVFSNDRGRSWSLPSPFYAMQQHGWGYVDLAVDSQDRIYGVTQADGNIIWAQWVGPAVGWKMLGVVAPAQGSRWGARVRVALTNGNRLHAVWMKEIDKNIDVYYSTVELDAPPAPSRQFLVAQLPTPASTPRAIEYPTPTPGPVSVASPAPVPAFDPAAKAGVSTTTAPTNALVIPVAITSALLLGVIIFTRQRIRQH